MSKRWRVGVLGATGLAGQRYVSLLSEHPWFDLTWLAASPRSAGRSYREAVAGRWHGAGGPPEHVAGLKVRRVSEVKAGAKACDLIFSAVTSPVAREFEMRYAAAGAPIVSNASAHRGDPDVPVVVPEINPGHLDVIRMQRKERGFERGFVVAKPNCSLQSYLAPLVALDERFGVERVIVTTLQALSGAGHPGVSSMDVIDNVIPLIPGEEEKSEGEPLKILGKVGRRGIAPRRGLDISAHCNRVPVLDGHLACVSVGFRKRPGQKAIESAWRGFAGRPQELALPSAPRPALVLRDEPDRPQPRRDRDAGSGMAISVGRLRSCPVLDWRFVGLSHNVLRGAAGGGVLIAELLAAEGWL
ncbi:MAG: aspartate-semialdehyde dehydrogenase [Acidobacteriota bacterium]